MAKSTAAKDDNIPISEDQTKITDATRQKCIEALRDIVEDHPDKVITRNFFRVHSSLAESAWNGHFGTFDEYKRQAGITLSRHARRLEKAIGKNAAADNYRKINIEKSGWEGKYLRPTGGLFKTTIGVNDVHDLECDPFWRRVVIDTIKRVKPDAVVLNGDVFDLYEFSRFVQDPREVKIIERIKWVHEFLADIRKACPGVELTIVEGNHEYRLLRHLAEATPAMRTILADLHHFTVSKLLGLDTYEVNFIARADLAAFNESDVKKQLGRNYWIGYGCLLACHYPDGKKMGFPGWNGHHHRHESEQHYSPMFKAYEWHQFGAGHRRRAVYTQGERWGTGFGIMHTSIASQTTQFEYIQIQDHVVVGGKYYIRLPSEIVTTI